MKLLLVTASLAATALLGWALTRDASSLATAPTPAPVEVAAAPEPAPAVLAAPPDVAPEPEPELEIASAAEPAAQEWEQVDAPRLLSREKLPDGRVQVKILSPVYYGDGTQKTLIRVLTGTPRYMKRERVMQRSAPRHWEPSPAEQDG